MFIGEKIHSIRKAKRITLVELSKSSGVQLATLSRIENKIMVGTLDSHIRIAKALGVDITELYKGIDKQNAIIEPGTIAKTEVFTHNENCTFDILTKNVLNKRMMPTLIRMDEGAKTNKEQQPNGSEKFIYVLDGSIEVTVEEQKFELKRNHTLYFDASLPHYYRNIGKSIAKVLSVATPVVL